MRKRESFRRPENMNPTVVSLGDLPLTAEETKEYPIPDDIYQKNPKEVLIYTFITIEEAEPGFKRGYYEIYTQRKKDGKQYKFYMNVAMTNDAVANSDNNWLPHGADFVKSIFVCLKGVNGTKIAPKGKKVKSSRGKEAAVVMKEHAGYGHDDADGVQVGQIFLTGYKI